MPLPAASAPALPGPRAEPGPDRRTASPGQGAGPGVATQALPAQRVLLRDAAGVAARTWRRPASQDDRDLSVRSLAGTLQDLHAFCARMSACSRLESILEPSPQGLTRAALVHAAAQSLGQAWLILSAAGTGVPPEPWQDPPEDLLQRTARRAVARWEPAVTVDDQALRLLAEAISSLAEGIGELAVTAAEPPAEILSAVCNCAATAAGQLSAAWQTACTAPAQHAAPGRPDAHDHPST
jgi:hypothetical protein